MRNKNLAIVAILLAVLTILALPWAASGVIAGPPVQGPDDVGEAQGEGGAGTRGGRGKIDENVGLAARPPLRPALTSPGVRRRTC